MTDAVLLNNIDHRDLRVETARGAEYGDAVMAALTFPGEFRNLQAHYPIVFQKDAEGHFQPIVLLGLQAGDNLFLDGHTWDAYYLPLAVERQPFLIGVDGDEPMIHVDMDHPRVRAGAHTGTGEPVFREHGGTTDYLEQINSILQALHHGLQTTPAFVDALLKHELLESFVLDVALDEAHQSRLAGYYTIDEDRLRALDGAAVSALAEQNHLEPIYMAIASMARFRDLIERQRRRGLNA